MKALLLALMIWPVFGHAGETNDPARILRGEIWSSPSRLERITRDYVKREKIEFTFENTARGVAIEKRGTNSVATIWFASAMGKPFLQVEIAPSGKVLTNHLGIGICGTGSMR